MLSLVVVGVATRSSIELEDKVEEIDEEEVEVLI
jgi:hypothetical protein